MWNDHQIRVKSLLLCGCAVLLLPGRVQGQEPQQRDVLLTGHLTVQGVEPGARVDVWIPEPQSTPLQQVDRTLRRADFPLRQTRESRYGNTMQYASGQSPQSSRLQFELLWSIERTEFQSGTNRPQSLLSDEARERWLRGTDRVPVGGRPLQLIDPQALPETDQERARCFYDLVLSHMTYDKSRPGYGTGDAVWACDSRFGNCTDFHSLFNSLARSHGIPARFEIGYSLPVDAAAGKIPGYHCWTWFYLADIGWNPVDISEADKHPDRTEYCFGSLSADRVTFSAGRDLVLEPPQQGPPLNYFVVPHVEVDGKVPEDVSIEFTLSYERADADPR